MKSPGQISLAVIAVVGALVLMGCQPGSANSTAAERAVTLGPQFSAKEGLLVPEDTRQSLELKIVEVTEQKVSAAVELQLRVYLSGDSTSLASGTVTPEQARQLNTGQPVRIRTSAKDYLTGRVTGMNDQLQQATGVIEVLAELPNRNGELAVGTFLEASIEVPTGDTVTTIPRAALLQHSDGYSVYTVSGEHLIRTTVKVGAVNAEFVEIRDGLYAGDQVVLQPVMSLWLTELAAVKGGQACCVAPPKGK